MNIGSIEGHFSFFRRPTYDPNFFAGIMEKVTLDTGSEDAMSDSRFDRRRVCLKAFAVLQLVSPSLPRFALYQPALLGNCLELCDKNG